MKELKDISIRGRVAYLICSFEKMLVHYHYDKETWRLVLEKLWSYTSMECLEDWMYELAEYLPNSVLHDTMDDAEYITENEFRYLYKLYSNTIQDVHSFLGIIFLCGTLEMYSTIRGHSFTTIEEVEKAVAILKANNIDIMPIEPFMKYSFEEDGGWGKKFDGRSLSIMI